MSDVTNAMSTRLRYADEPLMALHHDLLRTVGFIVRDGVPTGTCFLLRGPSARHPERRTWDLGYLITAGHNVPPDGVQREVWMTDADGTLVRGLKPHWIHHEDGEDIAVAPFVSPNGAEGEWYAPHIDMYAVDSLGIVSLPPGADIAYVGLLQPLGSMRDRGQPMVRTATIGAQYVPDVQYDKQQYRARQAHLIDCRSRAGFSGSPCFATLDFPGPRLYPLPDAWRRETPPGVFDKLGAIHGFAALWGMLVGYGDDPGVGIVLPVECIREAINAPELIDMREKADDLREQMEREEDNGFEAISAEGDTVSLAPLAFDEALKALLNTPPHPESE